jgi:hypothetical protein
MPFVSHLYCKFFFFTSLPVNYIYFPVGSGPVIAENLEPMANIIQLSFSYFHGRVIILLMHCHINCSAKCYYIFVHYTIYLLIAGFLLGLLYDPEDGSDMFL